MHVMASSSGTYRGGINKQHHNSVAHSFNGGSVHGDGEWGVPTFQHQQSISMDWTAEEQVQIEKGLAQYAPESTIIRYAKVAVQIRNKTVRDVALRCRWMTKKEISKRRKEDFNARKNKDRKEKFIESTAKPSRFSIQSPGMNDDNNNDNVNDITRQLLQQNAWAFKQISTNLSTTHQIQENMELLSRARDNIFKILTNLNVMGPRMKKMPDLPKLNEELANSILPPINYPIQL